jgi:hypothetical protein
MLLNLILNLTIGTGILFLAEPPPQNPNLVNPESDLGEEEEIDDLKRRQKKFSQIELA